MVEAIDITGQKFGRLTALNFSHKAGHNHYWNCICECGNTIIVQKHSLTAGNTKSCGCYKKELALKRVTTHGMTKTRLYKIWGGIKSRCFDRNCTIYKYYGGRGITICNEWKRDFMSFYKWAVANGYKEDLTIDRINNDGNYKPSNCRWIAHKKQCRNRRSNKLITYDGKTLCVSEMAEKYGLETNTLDSRLRRGWTIERALKPN